MGLFDTYGDSNARAIDYQATLPPDPPKPQPKWNAWSSPLRGPVSGVAKSLANLADVVQGYGAAGAIAAEADPAAVAVLGKQAVEQGAAEGRRQLATGEATRSEVGASLRAAADHYKPDPATAGHAEQMVFELTGGITQALAHAFTMGPAAPVTFGVDTGMQTANDLTAKGVDPQTALKAAAASGGVNALGFLLPVAGKTWGQTLGLGALSGPVSFMAGQQATRSILKQADYAKIAEQYDPLEPWGLAASLLPFGFGALAMRGRGRVPQNAPAEAGTAPPVAAATKVPPEVVDAAMVHNLTLSGEQARLVGEMGQQPNLSATERGIETRFAAQIARDPEAAIQAYNALPETKGGKVVNTDAARDLSPDYTASKDARSLYARAVHEPASWLASQIWSRLLAKPPETGKVLILGGGGGSGKTSSLEGVMPGYEARFDAIFDTTMGDQMSAVKRIEMALSTGRKVDIAYTARDPFESIANGIIPRAARDGRTVPLDIAARAHEQAPRVLASLMERYADDPRVSFMLVDNTKGPGQAAFTTNLPVFDYNGLVERGTSAARQAYEAGKISDAALRGLVGEGEAEAARRLRQSAAGPRPAAAGAGPEQGGTRSGEASEVITERGLVVPVRYRLAEASDLITSHGNDLQTNPAFPAELQPRDRTRAASADQIARIENNLRPELLGESIKASDGAPIIGPDLVVESGNARTIALRRAYESGKADGYKAWLTANAERFGLRADDVMGMSRPVLVRENTGKVDRAEFARQANESTIAALSPAEQAKADAARMVDLSGLNASEDGSINMAKSAGFIRQFMDRSVAPTERSAMMQSDGRLSAAGQRRIQNAVFSKAYGDAELVAMLAESTDSNVRNILNGLLRAAPDVARLQDLIGAGARHPINVAEQIAAAVREYSKIRESGVPLDEFLRQGNLLGDGPSPEMNNLLVGLQENSRSAKRVAEMVRGYVQAVDSLGDPRQAGLLDAPTPTAADATASAVERMRTLTDAQIADVEPAKVEASADPLLRSVSDRLEQVLRDQPDLIVGHDAEGKPITAADEIARARAEAANGTDVELGALDAELVQVAANCALSVGSA